MKLGLGANYDHSSERTSIRTSGSIAYVGRKPGAEKRFRNRSNGDVLEPGGLNVERVR